MRNVSFARGALLVLALAGAGCTKRGPAQESEPATSGAAEGKPEAIQLEAPMASRIGISAVVEKRLSSLLMSTGKVQFNEDRKANIVPLVGGQVLGLSVKVGDPVRKGEQLFLVHSREVAAAIAEHLESERDADLAGKTLAMTRDLFEHGAASRMALEQAENGLAKAKVRTGRTEESLRMLGAVTGPGGTLAMSPRMPVTSPIDGVVIERGITDGQFLQLDGRPALVVADLSTVWVIADVFERDLHLIHPGQRAELTTTAYPNTRFVAQVARIHDTVDPQTRTLKVRFLVANPERHLKPEMFASITLSLNGAAPVLTLPANSVFTEAGRSYVYVAAGERTFVRRPVEVQPDASGGLRVLAGLKRGERVVSEGALLVRLQEDKAQ